MSETWKDKDRSCAPCRDCGTELYDKFWGNGGWVPTETGTDKAHGPTDCVKVLRARWVQMRQWARDCAPGTLKYMIDVEGKRVSQ
jgi:hypothetical protein